MHNRLTVFNQKGGVGKTTTALNLGAALARRGLLPVLVDLDAQAHVLAAVLDATGTPDAVVLALSAGAPVALRLAELHPGRVRCVVLVSPVTGPDAPALTAFDRMLMGRPALLGVRVALRVIPGSAKSTRVEYRVAAADANPYLALAAAIASGLWGVENGIEPPPHIEGNSYEKKHPAKVQLPRTLMEAAGRLRASKPARDLFGDAFVDHYAATREWEEREFRKAITEWELDRYMEII